MKRRTTCRRRRRPFIAVLASTAAIICCNSGSGIFLVVEATSTSASASTSSATSTMSSTSASTTTTTTTTVPSSSSSKPSIGQALSSFFEKFDSIGPTLTLTLRDPSSMALVGGGSRSYFGVCHDEWRGGGLQRTLPSSLQSSSKMTRRKEAAVALTDDGTFGLSSKLAALFHISPTTASVSSNGRPTSSSTSSTTPSSSSSPFSNGYMLDDGDIFLEPPSSSSSIESEASTTASSSLRGLFSLKQVGDNIAKSGWGKTSWSECVRNVHPELRFEMHTRQPQLSTMPTFTTTTTTTTTSAAPSSSTSSTAGIIGNGSNATNAQLAEDNRPFPIIAPWLSTLSCGMAWRPFPMVYSPHVEDGNGHKLMSTPHLFRARAKLSVPRLSSMVRRLTSTSRGITNQFTLIDSNNSKKEVDLSVTYQKRQFSSHGSDGMVELVLGTPTSTLSPAFKSSAILDRYRKNNHLLIRLATGSRRGASGYNGNNFMSTTATTNTAIHNPTSFLQQLSSSIEYIKGSIRIPNPLFLCSKGVSISPSYNFRDASARCVFSGEVGSSGRTRAVLRLDAFEDSTLTVVRALDDNKIIAPTISLNSGKIVYDYYLNLDGSSRSSGNANHKVNSSIRAHVDPTTGIILKWTDGIKGDAGGGEGSCWVTECRIPLGTSGPGPLASDVRVGRRWVIG